MSDRLSALAFCGAFNPPTRAHLELPELALMKTGREAVVFVPSKSRYIAEDQGKDYAFSEEQRLAMLRACAEKRPWMRVWDGEIRAKRQPRTYETLCRLREEGVDASLLLGSDKLPELAHLWLHVPEIAKEFGIVCLARNSDDCVAIIAEDPFLTTLSECITLVATPPGTREVSSSQARALLREDGKEAKEALSRILPEEVLRMLEKPEQDV
ncbi:MAG: nicotinate-nicotinamide nucleotide adenylyltransferase [Clostridiales bacterium]|nr:nicotinate-nicotinamide nucleotide adenylyltransferase [Clostridiales bacterium]